MREILVLRGIPASGKSTYAKTWVAADPGKRARVNRDDIRFSVFGKYVGLTYTDEEIVTNIERGMVKSLLDAGKSVVVDSMCIRPKYVREWMKFADRNKVAFATAEFPIGLDEAILRDAAREKSVGEDFLRMVWKKYTKNGAMLKVDYTPSVDPDALEAYVPDESLPKAIIIDIDGTVAHNDGHRGWYEYSKVGNDKPKKDVITIIAALVSQGFYPIFLSGRTDDCYKETLSWLSTHIPFKVDTLLMRKTGDHRKDSLIKYEIFNEHIRGKYNVVAAWDDRKQVTEMWRSIGLLVNQVDFGDF